MPPRISGPHNIRPSSASSSCFPSPFHCCHASRCGIRSFSTTPRQSTRHRRSMFRWLNGPGAAFREPLPNSTNYLCAYGANGELIRAAGRRQAQSSEAKDDASDQAESADPDEDTFEFTSQVEAVDQSIRQEKEKRQEAVSALPPARGDDLRPFPLNRHFRSQTVLSEDFREEIWRMVTQDGKDVKAVSAEMGVEMNRVGAVVRLKTMEKEWVKKGKPLAKPYSRAVLAMLPQSDYRNGSPFEPINDLPTHAATVQQIFYPTSESRVFTRRDAAKVFDPTLLPADDRVPHPELVALHKDVISGMTKVERADALKQRTKAEAEKREARERKAREKEQREVKVVAGRRWDFRFRDMSVEDAGRDGRGPKGVGWRYGIPHEDRKKGQIKIPTRVE